MQRSLAGADLIIDAIFGTGYKPREDASPTQELARGCNRRDQCGFGAGALG